VTCTNCGVKLERVLPGVPYYALSFIAALLVEILAVASLFLLVEHEWMWIAGVAVALFGLMLSGAALLDSVSGMFWTNALLIPSILIWLAGVALRGPRS